MANYYCEYCGIKDSSVFSLTANSCQRHPNGSGKHKLYEGSEKTKYTCKFCGQTADSIFSLTLNTCFRNSGGNRKHSPAL
ncbi:DNA-directed RNA polymerase subunit RPC12/RpoP [Flavobacterium arsenatis]|uniref:DNA-directed RNA polymerase subunit RPC12/RpoP n=1 Tax=Flavobacterium arsenatis TaxID=1484332 RepID=A0ABU1TNQ6_9FLAO|nr:hypothetical protein [Flavobacterium arsenatis]MDR6967581.1 DNA-directed RNA polymerase subunit RPC12/RpoP [Flavobacterium arsenatis]